MTQRVLRAVLRRAVAVAALAVVAACSSTVSGHGNRTGSASGAAASEPPDFPSSTSATQSGPPSSSTGAPASSAPSAPASGGASSAPYTVVTVTGTSTGATYVAHAYARDVITDCAAHAYGAKLVAFLRTHPCGSTRRVLATVPFQGRTVVLSAISTSFTGTSQDPYVNTEAFVKLERADGTGSINDLLREGHRIPGAAARIPNTEAFQVLAQDNGVTVFDGWWASGTTANQDPALIKLETDLFLTPLTVG